MQRSSQSIAALAGALAKAQIELANPQKSLVGTIAAGPRAGKGGEGGGAERLFRYASLADGLEIVRKALGQHEIATVQTTAIDQSVGAVNLTTVLAHSSGEWIASDWPVCAIADTAEPHRMGAALTYARRYALFTLVGIAGEDDLDAPDLIAPTAVTAGRGNNKPTHEQGKPRGSNGLAGVEGRRLRSRHSHIASRPMLSSQQSATQRDRLLQEIATLRQADSAAAWAQKVLSVKNRLTVEDAKAVETAFTDKLTEFVPEVTGVITEQSAPIPQPSLVFPEALKVSAFLASGNSANCDARDGGSVSISAAADLLSNDNGEAAIS
jgi:hypothetical protein